MISSLSEGSSHPLSSTVSSPSPLLELTVKTVLSSRGVEISSYCVVNNICWLVHRRTVCVGLTSHLAMHICVMLIDHADPLLDCIHCVPRLLCAIVVRRFFSANFCANWVPSSLSSRLMLSMRINEEFETKAPRLVHSDDGTKLHIVFTKDTVSTSAFLTCLWHCFPWILKPWRSCIFLCYPSETIP